MRPLTFGRGIWVSSDKGWASWPAAGPLETSSVARISDVTKNVARKNFAILCFIDLPHGFDVHVHSFPITIRHGAHFAVTFKSSKCVTESAFVHSPILPATLNVSSVASIFLLPS